ncbi:protein SMAX1-LIKE 6 isoform X2 [Gossypium hirsutum]|uniref:Protein SMAX1-LIKE 6 isoform X2 n=1 Tax=Gossypium hirsutum TaxID=3635 RepID=A0ABM2YUZ9_GOSHI|nr:protein SMAX1-LIKE 6-like isoform X2 [Gossypium hirsutum]
MPTPISVARQCLTPEAADALDEAVTVARRREHAQTTSLHAVSALLSVSSSSSLSLRAACSRARNVAYPPRHQFKALELCISVSLDRVPSGQLTDDPPVSNSLMAAIKRSQANQRRQQPENFNIYRDISQQNGSNISSIQVDLRHLILSILDDPVVSRVFAEAGFRSSEIKLAITCPLPNHPPFPRRRGPPVFLCNLENPNPDPGPRGFTFPFPFPGFSSYFENRNRIVELLARRRNPLLVGACAYDALTNFTAQSKDIFHIISIGDYITKCINDGFNKTEADSKFEEMGRVVERKTGGSGLLVVDYGGLEAFVNGENENEEEEGGVSYIVGQLTRLLQVHEGNFYVLGAATSYQTYLKFICRFPSVEKHWDLQILPITVIRSSLPRSYPKSRLFPTPSESKGSLTDSYQSVPPHCHLCSERYEQEVIALSKGGFDVSVADQYRSALPSWLQMAELGANNGSYMKTKDDGLLLNAKIAGLRKKWDDICWRLHHTHRVPESNAYKPNPWGHCSNNTNVSSCSTIKFPKMPTMRSNGGNFEALEPISPCSLSNSSVDNVSRTSPTSVTSVTTDLGLGLYSVSSSNKLTKLTDQNHATLVNDGVLCHQAQFSSSSSPDFGGPLDPSYFKKLFKAVTEKVGWQDEAASVICQTVANGRALNRKCHGAGRRGDIWLNFSGPDRCGKKKIAAALADVIYGSRENFISIDLSSEDGVMHFDLKFRGKTTINYVAEELSKKPLSVVFLENVDKADIHVLSSLLRAIRTGKLSDSHRREVSTNNAILVTTSTLNTENRVIIHRKTPMYSEENILRAKGWPLQILVKHDNNPIGISRKSFSNKRKHEIKEIAAKRTNPTPFRNLDLNIPAEETDDGTVENTSPWLQHFFNQPVKNVIFKPFDFDTLAQKVSHHINRSFHESINSAYCSLEIDPNVTEQLLAAAYLSDDNMIVVTDWISKVLTKGFTEVEKKYNLGSHTIVKIIPDRTALLSENPIGVSLPPKITVN